MKPNVITSTLSVFLWILTVETNAQTIPSLDVQPKIPVLENFTRYGEIPVDLSTGVPKIEIPLYKIQVNDIEIPITISYHASGIKVDDIPSEIGLGWVLNSVGLVVKNTIGEGDGTAVAGRMDTSDEILADRVNHANNPGAIVDKYYNIVTGVWKKDKFTDRFTYSLPTGETGVFRENYEGGTYYTIPYEPIILDLSPGTNDHWDLKILNSEGIEFLYKSHGAWNGPTVYVPYNIISANKADTVKISASIDFNSDYLFSNSESVIISDDYPELNCTAIGCATCFLDNESGDYYYSQHSIITSHPIPNIIIDSIETRDEIIIFNNATYQNFLGDEMNRLQSFTIKQKQGQKDVIKQFFFDNDHYFGTDAGNYRLKLEGLKITDNNYNTAQAYSFIYNSTNLPNYYLNGRYYYSDYWGYYNGVKKMHLIPDFLKAFPSTDRLHSLDCGDLHPNEVYAKACILESIHYPTGGRTEFEYESNKADYNPYPYVKTNNTLSMGGIRIKRIINFSQKNDTALIKKYSYFEPHYKEFSNYHYSYNGNAFVQYIENACNADYEYYDYQVCTSNPVRPITMFNGPSVLYGKVIEQLRSEGETLGKTEYQYEINEPESIQTDAELDLEYLYYNPYLWDAGNYIPKLIEETVYKKTSSGFSPVLHKSYDYTECACDTFITGISIASSQQIEPRGNANSTSILAAYGYQNYLNTLIYFDTKGITNNSKLKNLTINQITDDGTVRETTNYEYNNICLKVAENFTNSEGDNISQHTIYPNNFKNNSSGFAKEMYDANILSKPIETYTVKDSTQVISGSLINYKIGDNIGLVDSVFTLNKVDGLLLNSEFYPCNNAGNYSRDDNYIMKYTIDSYNQNSKPTRLATKDGLTTAYLWGFSDQYPVAKITSGSSFTVSSTIQNNIKSHTFYGLDDKTKVDMDIAYLSSQLALFLNNKTYQVTLFTYAPLVGMTSQTDPKGVTTYYEYDAFGRLKCTKDDDGNILKQYDYHYSNQ